MTRRFAGRRPTATAAAAALASCRDAPTATGPQRVATAAVRRDAGSAPVPDAGLNPNDTQIEVELYEDRVYDVAFDSAVVDPATGALTNTLHIEAPPNHVLLVGGYDMSGLPRFVTTDLNTQNGTGQDLALTTIGGPNDLTVYGVDGTRLDATPQIGLAPGGNPLATFGLDATTDVTAGFLGDSVAPSGAAFSRGVGPTTAASTAGRPATPSASPGATASDCNTA